MTDAKTDSPIIPDWDDIPEDDGAEPEDADVTHAASVEEVDEAVGR